MDPHVAYLEGQDDFISMFIMGISKVIIDGYRGY